MHLPTVRGRPLILGVAVALAVGLSAVTALPANASPVKPPSQPATSTSATSAPAKPGKKPDVQPKSLPQRRLADSPRGGVHVDPVNGARRSAAQPGAGSTVDNSVPPLLPGSPVQHSIHVYVIYWGSSWNCTTGTNCAIQQQIRADMSTFFNGVSNSSYQRILHQYYDGTGHISNQVTFSGSTVDVGTVPGTVGQKGTAGDIPAEVDRVVTANNWINSADTQFIVVTPPGATSVMPNGGGNGRFCAYHGYDSANGTGTQTYVYSLIPYQPDINGCVVGSTTSPAAVAATTTRVTSHEYAESATDPDTVNGWRTTANVQAEQTPSSEIGDMCNYKTATAFGVTVQLEWSNAINDCALSGSPLAVQTLNGDACNANILAANDDGSTGAVALPFPVNFFGNTYASAYVNNNGNITFDGPLSTYTPFGLTTNVGTPIIAPFFADVDTRGTGSNVVHYGASQDGHTFCVNWVDVGYYGERTDKLNSFQLLLFDRSQNSGGHPGDFDMVMNYDNMTWETGDASGGANGFGGASAHAGYSNGTGSAGTYYEFPGSGVNGALLDSSPNGLINSNLNSPGQNGRYIFQVRSGSAPTGGSISGHVYANSNDPPNALLGAFVQVCPDAGGTCRTSSTGSDGGYQVGGLADGSYTIRAMPPGGSSLHPGTLGPETISGGNSLTGQDIVLTGPLPIPAGTTITNLYITGGEPTVYWQDPLVLTTHGCPGGTANYTVAGSSLFASGNMTESNGTYTATIPALYPNHGDARVTVTIHCPDGTTPTVVFDIYIDPSGQVVDQFNNPVAGATVTLLHSDDVSGPFTPVPDGSGIMSPTNQHNPDTTNSRGLFGWDVLAGYYQVRAEKVGCVSPTDPAQPYVLSQTLTIPPPVTGLVLQLHCNQPPVANNQTVTTQQDTTATVTLTATDPDSNPLTYSIVDGPAHGTLSGTAPNLTYTPAAGYSGADSFTFKANDGQADSNVATVSITVTPRATCQTTAPTLDASVSADQRTASTTFNANGFSTSAGGELILAFVEADGPSSATQTVRSITGGGLTWTLAARSNLTFGTTEVWQAYATGKLTNVRITATLGRSYDGSITVAAFRGAGTHVGSTASASGTTGSPTAVLTPTHCGSLVWAAGHDWSRATAPNPPAGQTLVHSFLDTRVSDAFWTQKVDAATHDTSPITVSDTGPTGRWTLAVVEIPGT